MSEQTIKDLIQRIRAFGELKSEQEAKLPFHFNVIDELRSYENDHSKLLAKLLQYRDKESETNKFPFLKSFLLRFGIKRDIDQPEITAEKDRIDLLIRDKKFAVIVENKIHGAVDQHDQIERYIGIVNTEKGYDPNKIYVVYLTRDGLKKVSSKSIDEKERIDLEKKGRFIEANFKDHVLAWLENDVLPSCKYKEVPLIQGIEQYIDHLKGLFYLRTDMSTMKEEMEKFIKDYLKSEKKEISESQALNEEIAKTEFYLKNLNSIKNNSVNSYQRGFVLNLQKKLNSNKTDSWTFVRRVYLDASITDDIHLDNIGFRLDGYLCKIGDNTPVFLSIEIQDKARFLCGVFLEGNKKLGAELKDVFEKHKIKVNASKWWVVLSSGEYNINGENLGNTLFTPEWIQYYDQNKEQVIESFYKKIMKVVEVWKKICEKHPVIDLEKKETETTYSKAEVS